MIPLYLGVSFSWAWVAWFLCALISRGTVHLPLTLTAIVGSFGPFLAAGLCVAVNSGWRGALRFYARALAWRMGWGVLAAGLFLMPAIAVLSAVIYARQFHQPFAFQITWAELPVAYLWLFLLGGPVAEEFGWSYLSDRLDMRLPIDAATLALGVVWAFWHLPLFFLTVPGLTQRYIPFAAFLAMSVAARFLFSWAYHRGGRSILSNLLFHNSVNLSLTIVVIVAPGTTHLRLYYFTALAAVAAALLWRLAPLTTAPKSAPTGWRAG